MTKKKLPLILVILVLIGVLIGIFALIISRISQSPKIQEPREINISGNIVCLPKEGTIVTMECAMGLVDANNNYYELTYESRNTEISNIINDGGSVLIEGTISTSKKSKYKTVGSIEVKTIKSLK